MAALTQFVGRPDLAKGRKLLDQGHHGVFDLLTDAVLMEGSVAPRLFLERLDTPFCVGLFDVVEMLPAHAHHAARLGHVVEQIAQFK